MTIKDLMTRLVGMFPRAFADQTSMDAWRETYQEALGHLKPEQLDAAFKATMQEWEKPGPPMPKFILAQVSRSAYGAPASASNPRSMKAMSDALPGLIGDLMAEWWKANAHWFDEECEARLVTGDKARTVRWAMNGELRKAANRQGQINFWKETSDPVTLTEDAIENAFSFAVPQTIEQWRNASAKALGAAARRIAERATGRGEDLPAPDAPPASPPPQRDPSGTRDALDDLLEDDRNNDEDAA